MERKQGTKLWTCVRRVPRPGTLWGLLVLGVLVLLPIAVGGCPLSLSPPVAICDADTPCADDGNFCNGVEECVDGSCVSPGDPCATGTTCNEETDHCNECVDGTDCDDANPCTTDACANGQCANESNTEACDDEDSCTENDSCADGACAGAQKDCDDNNVCTTDSCSADGECVNIELDCASDICVDGLCVCLCDVDADCDDGDACTTETCMDCLCKSEPLDCDNGAFCDGTESCDPETGECVSSGSPCSGETPDCDEDTDACVPICDCSEDADCDDGLFCNGIESCGVGCNCVMGPRPCDDEGALCGDCAADNSTPCATEVCYEDETAAVCWPPPIVDSGELTLNADNLLGTNCDDSFNAPLEFNPGTGAQVGTFQTGDRVQGFGGNDTLGVTLNAAAAVVPTLVESVENILIQNFGNGNPDDGNVATLNAVNIVGVDRIIQIGSIDDLAVTALQELTDFGFTNVGDTSVDISLNFEVPGITSSTNDQITCTLQDSMAGMATLVTASTNGFEIINIVSNGTAANRLTGLVQTFGTTLHTVVISGSADLELGTIPSSVVTIDTSSFEGTLTRLP